jgi:hypothetical protein
MKSSVLVLVGLVAGGCSIWAPTEPQTHELAERYERDGFAVEYLAGIDRFTFIGATEEDAPNMVRKRRVREAPAADGSYTFYGGVYTWVAPQGGELGWEDADGNKLEWPPDPAMDTGPTVRTARTSYGHTTTGRVHRSGLREVKTFEIQKNRKAELSYTLENTTDEMITAGAWVNMAVHDDSVIALRMDEGTGVYGWDERSVGLLEGVLGPETGSGWRTVRIADCSWSGGMKVYIAGSYEIAIWRDGWWLYRKNEGAYDERLRDYGEGPVAVYLQPDERIYEAELYGPLVDIPAQGGATSKETWRLIESDGAVVKRLPK